jgi:hypothetical protein
MTTLTVLNNPCAQLYFNEDTKIVHHHLNNGIDSTSLRDVLDRGIETLKRYGATKWLSDNKDIDPLSDDDAKWVNTSWLPRAIASGWKYWALVVPDSMKARMNMREFVESFYNQGVRVMVFIDVEEAMHWLEAQK